MDYKGLAWPTKLIGGFTVRAIVGCLECNEGGMGNVTAETTILSATLQENHIFAIGDWCGMDGSLEPVEGLLPACLLRSHDKALCPWARGTQLRTWFRVVYYFDPPSAP